MGEPEISEATGTGVGDEPAHVPLRPHDPLFVGRRSELAALDAALFASRQDVATVIVEGESGIGKSALVARFVELAHAREPRLVALHGRCHEGERIPFNAFGGVIDNLTRLLLTARPGKLEKMVPSGVGPLLTVFPALAAVDVLARAAREARPVANVRGNAFTALRELLVRVCRRRPTVIAIEDVQWADRDSWALLAELVRTGDEAPRICVVATRRSGVAAPVERLGKHRTLSLGGLDARDAEELVYKVSPGTGAKVARIIAETRGHPLYVRELALQSATMQLDDAIRARASRLDTGARKLLDAVAVAGSPIPRHIAIALAGLTITDAEPLIATLLRDALVRVNGPTPQCAIEPLHDRIRDAMIAQQPLDRQRELQHSLGRALEAAGAPAGRLVSRFQAAGDADRAATQLVAAAEAARKAFAFGSATELFQRALETAGLSRERRAWLLVQLAETLASDGHTAEAAERFVEASELEEPRSDRQLDLLRRGAERFLMSGRLAQGLETTRSVLERANMTLPSSRARAIAGIAWNQFRMRGRRLHWTAPRNGARSPDADVCWSIGAGLGMVDSLLGAYFVGRAARIALANGNSLQICRAMAAATIGAAVLGHADRAGQLLSCGERAAQEDGSPLAQWYVGIGRAGLSFMTANDFARAFQHASALEDEWYAAGHGPSWETDVAMHFSLGACQMLGNMDELGRRVAKRVHDAKRAGDLFQELTLRMRFGVRYLAEDRPAEARQDVLDALGAWLPGTDSFGNQHAWALWSRTRTALYAGTLDDALEAEWARLQRSLVGRVPLLQIESLQAYGAYLLARAHRAKQKNLASEHAELCARVERIAARLGRLTFPAAPVSQHILRAGVAWARGNQDDILRLTRFALDQTIERGVLVYAAFLKRRLGEAMGGDEGGTLISQADALALRSGWVKPERGAQLALPTTPLA